MLERQSSAEPPAQPATRNPQPRPRASRRTASGSNRPRPWLRARATPRPRGKSGSAISRSTRTPFSSWTTPSWPSGTGRQPPQPTSWWSLATSTSAAWSGCARATSRFCAPCSAPARVSRAPRRAAQHGLPPTPAALRPASPPPLPAAAVQRPAAEPLLHAHPRAPRLQAGLRRARAPRERLPRRVTALIARAPRAPSPASRGASTRPTARPSRRTPRTAPQCSRSRTRASAPSRGRAPPSPS